MKKFGITCDKNGSEEKGFKKERKIMFKTIKKIFGALAIIGVFTGGTMAVANAPSFVQTAYAAQRTNSSEGYSIPKEITIKKGESKKINISRTGSASKEVYSVSFSNTRASYAGISNYNAGSRWDKEGSITVTGKANGYSTIVAYIKEYKKNGNTYTLQKSIELECRVNVTDAGSGSTAKAAVKNGWYKENGRFKYYKNGTAYTGWHLMGKAEGEKTEHWSYFGNNGLLRTGLQEMGKGTLNPDGNAAKHLSYFGDNGWLVTNKNITVGGKSYKADGRGWLTLVNNEKYWNVNEAYTLTNNFRTTRSNQWYWNSNNKTKTYTYGLKALTRDAKLEETAKLRAKEQWTQYYVNGKATHTRPNGKEWYTAYPSGLKYKRENLAWKHNSCSQVVLDANYGWAETNKKYSGQGHRRNMLASDVTKIGIACYEKDGKTSWAMCLGR